MESAREIVLAIGCECSVKTHNVIQLRMWTVDRAVVKMPQCERPSFSSAVFLGSAFSLRRRLPSPVELNPAKSPQPTKQRVTSFARIMIRTESENFFSAAKSRMLWATRQPIGSNVRSANRKKDLTYCCRL